jgi:hypothetical protein
MSVDIDIANDDLDAMRGLKKDLEAIVRRIESYMDARVLSEVDKGLFATRAVDMELALNDILAPDWKRASIAARSASPLPRSDRFVGLMFRESLRVPSNPATYAAKGSPL